jgi:hypothetical protein
LKSWTHLPLNTGKVYSATIAAVIDSAVTDFCPLTQ